MLINSVYGLTCQDIMEMPEDTKITLELLQRTPPKDIVDCLVHLGKDKLPIEEAAYIWKTLLSYHGGPSNIPEKDLLSLHWITTAIEPEEYANITLTSVDVIQNFGLNYDLSPAQLSAIADSVRENFGGKEPEDYTYYDLIALRQILCSFNRSEIERIHPSAYREASLVIGKLRQCDPEVMQGFATLAVQRAAFGHPSTWTEATAETVGDVVSYLPQAFAKKFRAVVAKTINKD